MILNEDEAIKKFIDNTTRPNDWLDYKIKSISEADGNVSVCINLLWKRYNFVTTVVLNMSVYVYNNIKKGKVDRNIYKIKKTDSFGTWKFYSIELKNIGELTIEDL